MTNSMSVNERLIMARNQTDSGLDSMEFITLVAVTDMGGFYQGLGGYAPMSQDNFYFRLLQRNRGNKN